MCSKWEQQKEEKGEGWKGDGGREYFLLHVCFFFFLFIKNLIIPISK
jgi:hypothetical protein